MIQSSLCVHTVITWGPGPFVVTGFEAKDETGDNRLSNLWAYYVTGMEKQKKVVFLNRVSDQAILQSIEKKRKPKTALQEHMECLQRDKYPRQDGKKHENGGSQSESGEF